MSYTLTQAAKATGKSRQALHQSIKSGKISATRDTNGAWGIEPSELYRVYPPIKVDTNSIDSGIKNLTSRDSEIDLLNRVIDEKERLISSQETMIQSLESVISDLMVRLDNERDERQRLTVALLPGPKKRWWQW